MRLVQERSIVGQSSVIALNGGASTRSQIAYFHFIYFYADWKLTFPFGLQIKMESRPGLVRER